MTDMPASTALYPLISTTELAQLLADPAHAARLRIYDTTQHLKPNPAGSGLVVVSARGDFERVRLPGADYLDLQQDFSDATSPYRFALPPAEALARAFADAGIGPGIEPIEFVFYSSTSPMWATRFWWMLRWLGVPARVLDGGLPKWQAEGGALEAGAPPCTGYRYPATTPWLPRPVPGLWADKAEVERAIGNDAICTINALTAELHAGTAPYHYGRPGHITGSVNVPFPSLQQPSGALKPMADLREAFATSGALERERAICYCGGGIAATMTALALHLLGHRQVAVYDHSLQEWANDPAVPMNVAPAS